MPVKRKVQRKLYFTFKSQWWYNEWIQGKRHRHRVVIKLNRLVLAHGRRESHDKYELETRTFLTSSILKSKGKERNSKFGFPSLVMLSVGRRRFELVAAPIPDTLVYRSARLSSENRRVWRTLTASCTMRLWVSKLSEENGSILPNFLIVGTILWSFMLIASISMKNFCNMKWGQPLNSKGESWVNNILVVSCSINKNRNWLPHLLCYSLLRSNFNDEGWKYSYFYCLLLHFTSIIKANFTQKWSKRQKYSMAVHFVQQHV